MKSVDADNQGRKKRILEGKIHKRNATIEQRELKPNDDFSNNDILSPTSSSNIMIDLSGNGNLRLVKELKHTKKIRKDRKTSKCMLNLIKPTLVTSSNVSSHISSKLQSKRVTSSDQIRKTKTSNSLNYNC